MHHCTKGVDHTADVKEAEDNHQENHIAVQVLRLLHRHDHIIGHLPFLARYPICAICMLHELFLSEDILHTPDMRTSLVVDCSQSARCVALKS